MTDTDQADGTDIAVIGMAGRFAAAGDVDEFWRLVRDGREGIRRFSVDDLLAEGLPREVVTDPRYVPVKGALTGPDLFDAHFFGCTPREAAVIDPQQRVFLECAWEALERAGVDPETAGAAIGVYAGASAGTYLTLAPRDLALLPDAHEIILGNDKDQLTTRTSYKLGLTGPSVCVQSACSTSLVAVHIASQGLLSGDCDVALAGGVSVTFPANEGYFYREESINSRDGHCRAFDAAATGTVHGDGVGVVVLKLLDDALRDGDHVHAVIKGTAVNNDGAAKVGYAAPSVSGQAGVIRAAHRVAGVDPATIGYVEAHGTGTALGDPAEIAGLTRAFRSGTDRVGYCAIGSVKTNIGHLDVAAGIAGLIKAVLAVEHGVLPASLHFDRPNPAMAIETSPFYVNATTTPWPESGTPRRAGVSSFGIGGTNAHVVLEQAPLAPSREPVGIPHAGTPSLIVLSARTPAALETMTANLAAHLRDHPDLDLADVARTTQVARKAFEHRRFVVCGDTAEAVRALTGDGVAQPWATRRPEATPSVAFLFPGQGAQHLGMGAGLYASEPRYREEIERCRDILLGELAVDLRDVLLAEDGAGPDPDRTELAQPALFAVEYALARLWHERGVRPRALLGHSLGEYVAACLAGVFGLEDTLRLVAARGALMAGMPPGAMLSVRLPEAELAALLAGWPELSLAAVNAPDRCVVGGPPVAIDELARELAATGVAAARLHTSHAFHVPAMAPVAEALRAHVARLSVAAPEIPFVSSLTGTWITADQATDPDYWARHTLAPVRFADGLATVLRDGASTLVEAGPGRSLSVLARQQGGAVVVPSMRHPRSPRTGPNPDAAALAEAIGQVWSAGTAIDWPRGHPRRVPLPTYPFQRRSYRLARSGDNHAPAAVDVLVGPAEEEEPAVGDGFVEPRDERQRAVAAIWTELLGIARIGADDDFFRLGGDSLLATRLTTRLRETFGVEVKIRDLFATPTVAGLAKTLTALAQGMGERPGTRPDGYEEGEL